MSYAVHTKPIDALEWADIEALVTDGAEESATLEFKSAGIWGDAAFGINPDKPLLTADDMAKNDIVEAICGFANAYGGVLVIGVMTGDSPDRAVRLDPISAVEAKFRKLSEIGGTSFDPPLRSLDGRVVANPAVTGQGVIVFRVPASLIAPHAARYKVLTGNRSAQQPLKSDVPIWRAFVRVKADTIEMSMRDAQNVFWENKTLRERIRTIRHDGQRRLDELVGMRNSGKLQRRSAVDSQPILPALKGVFVRCTAIFQHRLSADIDVIRSFHLPTSTMIGSSADDIVSTFGDPRALVDGVLHPGRTGGGWRILRDGTIECVGFEEHRQYRGMKTAQAPGAYVALFARVVLSAHRLRRTCNQPYAPFEVDISLQLDLPIVVGGDYPWEPPEPADPEFSVGPFLVGSMGELEQSLKEGNVDLHRGFGIDVSAPQNQSFEFLARE